MTTPTATAKPATAPAAKTTRTRKPAASKATPVPAPQAPATSSLVEELGFAPAKTAKPKTAKNAEPKAKTAADYRRDVDLAIITAAGKLVTELVPEDLRSQVARLIANQLHHMSTPAQGWPSDVLPKPERSDWR